MQDLHKVVVNYAYDWSSATETLEEDLAEKKSSVLLSLLLKIGLN